MGQQLPETTGFPHVLAARFPSYPTSVWTPSTRLTLAAAIGCLLGSLGGSIRVWCHSTLGPFFTWSVALRDGHKLVTSGPYRFVRHPSYTGWYCIFTGNLLLIYTSGSFFVESGLLGTVLGKVVAAYVTVFMGWTCAGALQRTRTEDEMLRREFGQEWDRWARKTRYRLFPGVY